MTQPDYPQPAAGFGGRSADGARVMGWLLFACLVLPWLNARASGPSSSVEPWLVSALCGALAYGIFRAGAPRRALAIGLALVASFIVLRSGVTPDTLGAAGACLLVYMAAALAASGVRDEGFVRTLALSWLVAALASTVIALVQYFGLADVFSPWISSTVAGEAFANLRQRNQYASLTVIGMASLFWLAPRQLPRGLAFAAMALLAIGNAATTSRTGLAGILMLVVMAFVWPGDSRPRRALWLTGLVTYVAASFALPWLLQGATGTAGHHLWDRVGSIASCSSRSVLWSNVWHLILERPWTGWGWGELDWAHFETLYGGARFCDILDNAHNLPLHLAVELGVPASILACVAVLWAALRAKPWRETDPLRQMAWGVLAIIGLHSLFEYPLWYGPFQLAAGLALGLLLPSQASDDQPANPSLVAPVLAAFAIAACLYASWDYRRVTQIYLPAEARMPAYRDDPLPAVRQSWLFRSQARFAEVTVTPLTLENKEWMLENALAALHYSPEPRIVEKVIESATLLGRTDLAVAELARLRAAFPEAYEEWSKAKR